MEVDLKIYSNLSKKQYGFKRGSSTIAAVHKLVKKFEFAILNQGMALGTFLDIEGAFDNVSFNAIERALKLKCKSAEVNQWIRSMIHNRQTTVELQGERRTIAIRRGCPQLREGFSLLSCGTSLSTSYLSTPEIRFLATCKGSRMTWHWYQL